jgi:hypothetical protein
LRCSIAGHAEAGPLACADQMVGLRSSSGGQPELRHGFDRELRARLIPYVW